MRNLIETTIAPSISSSSLSQQHDLSATTLVQRSPWHSPVPYLFGGLAAMLGLIAFALLILACSYWKISGTETEGDAEKGDDEKEKVVRVYEEKIVVIMAGDEKPTYLATPVCSRGSSFGDDGRKIGQSQEMNGEEKLEKTKEDQVQVVVIQIPVLPIAEENANLEEASSMAAPATTSQSGENQ